MAKIRERNEQRNQEKKGIRGEERMIEKGPRKAVYMGGQNWARTVFVRLWHAAIQKNREKKGKESVKAKRTRVCGSPRCVQSRAAAASRGTFTGNGRRRNEQK